MLSEVLMQAVIKKAPGNKRVFQSEEFLGFISGVFFGYLFWPLHSRISIQGKQITLMKPKAREHK